MPSENAFSICQTSRHFGTANDTTMADRKQIVRCLVEKVVVIPDKCSERIDVTIVWQGGCSSQHQIVRPFMVMNNSKANFMRNSSNGLQNFTLKAF